MSRTNPFLPIFTRLCPNMMRRGALRYRRLRDASRPCALSTMASRRTPFARIAERWRHRSRRSIQLRPFLAAVVSSVIVFGAQGTATAGIVVLPAQSTFSTNCEGGNDIVVAGLSSVPVSCVENGFVGTTVVGTYTANGTAKTLIAASGAPTAETDQSATFSGQGGGSSELDSHLIYYVGLDTIATPPILPSEIPVDFSVFASVSATADAPSNSMIASIDAVADGYSNVSGRVGVDIGETASNALDKAVSDSGILMFDPSEGPAITRVKLDVMCDLALSAVGASAPGSGSGHTTCMADPLVGFDQSAFDALMGQNTFQLADFFTFVFSAGLEAPAAAVPEPGALALLGPGLILLGLMERRRRRG